MIVNPDKARRKDSLRQFVVALFDRKQLRQLASYPYIDMFDVLEHIIEERARSVDLNANRYYDFLYSFHVSKDNYRKAAHIMFECGMRLATEVRTVFLKYSAFRICNGSTDNGSVRRSLL